MTDADHLNDLSRLLAKYGRLSLQEAMQRLEDAEAERDALRLTRDSLIRALETVYTYQLPTRALNIIHAAIDAAHKEKS